MSSFGIVIATCKTDSHYAQASFWSIRHFLGPDMPVCFIVDGDAALLGSVRNDPQVSVLDRNSVANTWLREHCFGWGTTKMIAFYEAPFERFLYLDADALVIGNVPAFDDPTADMVTDCGQSYSDQDINFWFFNTESVERLYPDFDWRRFRHSYFCTGTFFSRKGVFSLEDLQEKMRLAASHPELFHFGGEMGFLNLMIFQAAQRGALAVHSVDYQTIPVDTDDILLRDRYSPQAVAQHRQADAVMHFCGKKAYVFTSSPKVALMNYFRLRYLLEFEQYSIFRSVLMMMRQDIQCLFVPLLKKFFRKISHNCKKFIYK